MGIDLSLRLTPHPDPHPRDPADDLVAWARGFVPIAWWILFAPGDAVMGPYGLALITRPEAALDRLRRRGPEIAALAEIAERARALGPDGGPLQEALGG